jgi:hypothetical protein
MHNHIHYMVNYIFDFIHNDIHKLVFKITSQEEFFVGYVVNKAIKEIASDKIE